MKINIESEHYKLVPHWSHALGVFHYHLVIDKSQQADVKYQDVFKSFMDIQDAELNEELTELLMYGISNGAKYIKVEILSEGGKNGQE